MRTPARKTPTQPDRSTQDAHRACGFSVGSGLAALIAATGLVMAGAPASGAAEADDGGQSSISAVPGEETGTDTPSLVTGLEEKADGTVSATNAARGYLAGRTGRYHIANPGKNLDAAGTSSEDGHEVVRLQQ